MRGVILAGGRGSRLYPLTSVVNKHLLPVGPYPMIYYPISSLAKARVREILIISNREDIGDVAKLLGSGHSLGLSFSYRVQDRPDGIAGALALAEDFGRGEPLVVLLGDNIFVEDLSGPVREFEEKRRGAMVFLKEVSDPENYGVARLKEGRIVDLQEKPEDPMSSLCVTGIYLYDESLFKIIEEMVPSDRGELEITDVNRAYMERGTLKYHILHSLWFDAGTLSSLLEGGRLFQDQRLPLFKEVE